MECVRALEAHSDGFGPENPIARITYGGRPEESICVIGAWLDVVARGKSGIVLLNYPNCCGRLLGTRCSSRARSRRAGLVSCNILPNDSANAGRNAARTVLEFDRDLIVWNSTFIKAPLNSACANILRGMAAARPQTD
jgi:hypothetical protein